MDRQLARRLVGGAGANLLKLGEASEVAAAVVFLVSDAASYITGQNFNVNGGDRTESYQ